MYLFKATTHLIVIIFAVLVSQWVIAIPTIDMDKCFSGYLDESAESTTYKAIDYLPWCLDSFRATPPGANNLNEHLISLQTALPNSPTLKTISERAANVFYNDNYCDKNNYKKYGVFCGKLGQFARLHPTGRYNYNCRLRNSSHSKCPEFSLLIIEKKERICNSGLMEKNYCNELISGFLSSPQCSPTSSTEDCQKHIDTQLTLARDKTKDPCAQEMHSVMDLSLCTGGNGILTTASTDPDGSDATHGDSSGSDSDGSAGSDITDNSDVQAVSEVANKLGNSIFGNPGKLNNYAYQGGKVDIPSTNNNLNISAQSGAGDQFNSSGDIQMGAITPLNTLANMMQPNPGGPGGAGSNGQPGGQTGGAPPRGGGAGGDFAGGGGGGSSSGGGNSGGRSGRRYSPKSEISKEMGQRFYGATGSPSSSGGGLTNSQLSPKIQKALERNKAKELAKRSVGQINAAFQAGLMGAGQGNSEIFLSPLYFPGMDEGMEYIKNTKSHLNDNGYEF